MDFLQCVKDEYNHSRYLTAEKIGFPNNKKRIVFVEQMTELNRELLKEAKLLHGHGFK